MKKNNHSGGETPKQQHYVYRKHLAPWTATKRSDGKIYCYKTDEKRIFPSNLTGVAQERYFNEYKVLTELEKIVAYFISRSNDFEGSGNDSFMFSVASLRSISEINDIEKYVDKNTFQSDEMSAFDRVRRQLGEKAQGFYEEYGLIYLSRLLENDASFFECENDRVKFFFYLMVQYSRTKKLRLQFKNSFKYTPDALRVIIEAHGHELALVNIPFDKSIALNELNSINESLDLEKVHPYVLDGLVHFVVKGLLARRKPELKFINAPSGCEFLTGDQPVVNLGGDEGDPSFFCPISPQKAIVVAFDKIKRNEFASEGEMLYYNQKLVENSGMYIFSTSEDNLEREIKNISRLCDEGS
ncbi:hypothetical protein SOASR015_38190 [Pectobacterium carotovorum subsp. carotovorum]|nr:hypothetical protein SOASR015_38190 [Pectobacterium carotovorum subsp. carotovorum]GLX58667.1 hypothetical protein Pcaca02_39760 [Pectobacterium carotovorum subsp. carotovorum]